MKEQEWICPVNPEDIPVKYNYVAQDHSGEWCAYIEQPNLCEELCAWLGFNEFYICSSEDNPNWRNTLMKIPRCS
jgi:hypothetical protein